MTSAGPLSPRTSIRFAVCLIASVVTFATSKQAAANQICAALATLITPGTSITQITLPSPFQAASKCSSALAQTGGRFTYCAWPFDYRAPAAGDAFKLLVDAVPACLGLDVAGKNDQKVNHPDFYDLHVFETPEAKVSVSLKDKAGLQQTYVFLRVQPVR